MLHTKTPWKANIVATRVRKELWGTVKIYSGKKVVAETPYHPGCNAWDDAKRIAACVNACAGLSTAELELCAKNGAHVVPNV